MKSTNSVFHSFACMIALAVGLLAGCATAGGGGLTPQSTVYATKSAYAGALQVAVAYKNLPACKAPPVLPCSDPQLVSRLQKADVAASATLDAAEVAVRMGGSTADRDKAIAAAQAAVAAFSSLASTLGASK